MDASSKRDIEGFVTCTRCWIGSRGILPRIVPVTQMRKTIARRLAESKFTAPHFYLKLSVDMDAAVEARKAINAQEGVKVSFNDMVVKAVSLALEKAPGRQQRLDGHLRSDQRPCSHRCGRGRGGRTARPRGAPCGPQIAHRNRCRGQGLRRQSPRQEIAAQRLGGQHLHHLQPRHVRNRGLYGHHQPT